MEMPRLAVQMVSDSFFEYMSTVNGSRSQRSLAGYINEWLSHGGVGDCGGNYVVFLKAVALIVDEWHRHPERLDFVGSREREIPPFHRRPSGTFDDEDFYVLFDADEFAIKVFVETEHSLALRLEGDKRK